MKRDMKTFLFPASVAIIGASDKVGTIPERTIRYVSGKGFEGEVYPVNPNKEEIYGYKCYPTIKDIPTIPDLVIVVVRAALVCDALKQSIDKGCKNIAIISSGFEGEKGKMMENQIVGLAEKYDLNISGPNHFGFYNIKHKLAANFSPAMDTEIAVSGPMAIISQSGALGFYWYTIGQDQNLGSSYVITTGNEAVLCVFDFAEYLLSDAEIKTICLYAETIKDGNSFVNAAQKALETNKPLIIYRAGKSDFGKKAALAHTGNISGHDELFDNISKQFGVIRASDYLHGLDIAKIILAPAGIPTGNRIASYSPSGGFGVALSDEVAEQGLVMTEFTDETYMKLLNVIPEFGSAKNPVDTSGQILANLDAFQEGLRLVANDANVDAVVISIGSATGPVANMAANDIAAIYKETNVPMVVAWVRTQTLVGDAIAILENAGIPVIQTPVRAAKALGPVIQFSLIRQAYLNKMPQGEPVEFDLKRQAQAREYIKNHKDSFTEYECKQLLSQYGIPITTEAVASSVAETCEKASEIGFPVVLKINSPGILHKSDVGGIKINIADSNALRTAYEEILRNCNRRLDIRGYSDEKYINKVLVQEMVSGGYEVILGAVNDTYGPVVMFGLGGVYVEMFKDVSYRLAPVSYQDALEMIDEIKSSKILKGARGKPKGDLDALAKTIVNFSHMIIELKNDFCQIDINPLIVLPEGEGVRVVDALIVFK